MNLVITQIGGEHFRIADPDWADPLDSDGQLIGHTACQPIGQAAFHE